MREFLDKIIKADQCVQNVGDIGVFANDVKQLIETLRAMSKCIHPQGRPESSTVAKALKGIF